MKIMIRAFAVLIVTCIYLIACNTPAPPPATTQKFLDPASMDSSVKPSDNFYLFVNGGWLKKTVIPPTESSLGSFLDLYNSTQDKLHGIVEDLSKTTQTPGSVEQKVGDFYASGMDSITIDKRGYDPVKPYLQKIDAIKNAKDITQYVALLQSQNNGILFVQSIAPDEKNSHMDIAVYTQGGLSLPDRDYYFKKDPATQAIVSAYQQYLEKAFRYIGYDSASAVKKMIAVYDFEKKLASSHRTNVELRDPQSNYHKLAVKDLDQKMPAFGWKSTLETMSIHSDSVNVSQPAFFSKINELLSTVPIDTWKDYLRFHTLDVFGGGLSSDFKDVRFDFYGKALNGQKEMKPLWDRMVAATDFYLGDALGQVYAKKYFTEEAKKRMLELVNNEQAAFDARLDKLDWMSDVTKAKAKEKLHAFLKQVGYPDKWRDYSKVNIERDKYFENRISAQINEYQYQVNKVGKPVDRNEWDVTTPTINAGYYPTFNKILFPAGILQFPFFDLNADDAINYGAIGMFIGHEITHGFDDQGRQYDKDGNLKSWWTKEDSAKFVEKSNKVIALYNSFVVLDSVHVNGALTNGENIADIGGIAIAYDAFKMTKQGQDTTKIDGLTPDQRFFLSFAQAWRSKEKDEFTRFIVNTNPHSPDIWRVLGPLRNFQPFYAAFNVQPGDKMYVADSAKIKIW
ncbi:MAG: M13 family metallopeptidase [Bacteroidetes bacterium]|nr:M13 family metallopeptidase [Bacteroidota bacterium]